MSQGSADTSPAGTSSEAAGTLGQQEQQQEKPEHEPNSQQQQHPARAAVSEPDWMAAAVAAFPSKAIWPDGPNRHSQERRPSRDSDNKSPDYKQIKVTGGKVAEGSAKGSAAPGRAAAIAAAARNTLCACSRPLCDQSACWWSMAGRVLGQWLPEHCT